MKARGNKCRKILIISLKAPPPCLTCRAGSPPFQCYAGVAEVIILADASIASAAVEQGAIGTSAGDQESVTSDRPAEGRWDAVYDLVRRYGITDIIVDWPNQGRTALHEELCDRLLTLKLQLQGVQVHELSDFCERVLGRLPLHIHSAGGLAAENSYHFHSRWQAVKRAVDVVVATVLLTAMAPLFFAAAVAIRTNSRGPIIYRQERVGIGGRIFRIAKFRSMRIDAEKDGTPRFATRDDDRITTVGWFLRQTRIDELPQLFNVLAGDMSMVGPRPERPFFVTSFEQTLPLYGLRHRVKPGITGWAQVNEAYASSEAQTRAKLSRDLYYLKRGSLWMDIEIMAKTVRVMLARQGSQ